MTEQTCPNGCDLATFGTHAGPPDCDLRPADPEALLATGQAPGPDGQLRSVEFAVSGPLAATMRREALRGLSVEFASAPAEPVVRVCGIPDPSDLPRPVLEVLGALAEVIRDHYAIGVEVEGEGEREAAQLAVETLRRYLG